jgi:hypothetical protein
LEGRLKEALNISQARTSNSIGRENQIKHAQDRLLAIQKLLATPDGEHVFPDGPDLSSITAAHRSVLDDIA